MAQRVFVAMSGGVDSSVAALLLKERGYDVTGVFMRCFNIDGCQTKDTEDARRVAAQLEIPFYVWDFEEEYKKRVVDYMVQGYRRGLTPNPDVMCNKEIKFGLFFDKAIEAGADYVSTGHYARLAKSTEQIANNKKPKAISYKLYAARDSAKDQSYFLWTLSQDRLQQTLFPIGEYEKSEVRAIARRAGLSTADKKDSQGICFLGKVTLADFLKEYIPEKRGAVLTTSGEKIGEHSGAYFYTIGQRHGLHLDRKNQTLRVKNHAETKPHYISGKDVTTNTVVVAEGIDNPALYRSEARLAQINFVNANAAKKKEMRVFARVRYRQPLVRATLTIADDTQTSAENFPRESASDPSQSMFLIFEKSQKFVAPGQSAVFYSEDGELLGGGVIVD